MGHGRVHDIYDQMTDSFGVGVGVVVDGMIRVRGGLNEANAGEVF